MRIRYGEGTTQYGPGVSIQLSGAEVAVAIDAYLAAHEVVVRGARTVTVNGSLCEAGEVYVDPEGFVVSKGKRWSGKGAADDGRTNSERRTFDADLLLDGEVIRKKALMIHKNHLNDGTLKMGHNTLRTMYLHIPWKLRKDEFSCKTNCREMFERLTVSVDGREYAFWYPPKNRVWPSKILKDVTPE